MSIRIAMRTRPVFRQRPFVLLFCAAALSGVCVFAQGSPPSTTLRMQGTIENYDPATQVLSISTPNATVVFPLTATARIRRGRRTINASDLKRLARYRVVVRYLESRGSRTVESIHVLGPDDRSRR